MTPMIRAATAVALAGAAATAHAQGAAACPQLAAATGLSWEYKAAGTTQFCRALRADGSEAFGLYVARESPFKPGRAARAEDSTIDGRRVQWYRSEIAGRPEVRARETVISLPDGRVAYLWIHARSDAELGEAVTQATTLRFGDARVAGNTP